MPKDSLWVSAILSFTAYNMKDASLRHTANLLDQNDFTCDDRKQFNALLFTIDSGFKFSTGHGRLNSRGIGPVK